MKMNPYNMPQIIKETSDGYFHLSVLDDLLSQREIYCLGEIDADSAGSLILQLQYLAAQDPEAEITLYINSPGGSVADGLALYDIMQTIPCPIRTVCMGTAASFGALLFTAGDTREIFPHSKIMIHDPLIAGQGLTGSATLLHTKIDSLMETRQILGELLARQTRSLKQQKQNPQQNHQKKKEIRTMTNKTTTLMKPVSTTLNDNHRILAQGRYINNNTWQTGLNNNDLIIGVSGAGKTRGYVIPNILHSNESMVIVDTKNTLSRRLSPHLKKEGYEVWNLNFAKMDQSPMGYNPLSCIERYTDQSYPYNTQDIEMLAEYLCPIECDKDPFWDYSARMFMATLIAYVMEALPENEKHLGSVAEIQEFMAKSMFKSLITEWGDAFPESYALQKWKLYKGTDSADKTHACIRMFVGEKLSSYTSKGALKMFSNPHQVDFRSLGRRKIALFINVSDTDRSNDKLLNLLYSQALHELCDSADCSPDGRLKVPVRFIMDDFASNAVIPDFDKVISVIRSREIYVSLILQSLSQLDSMYGKDRAMTIINNCDSCLYLGGQDVETARYIAVKANKTADTILTLPIDAALLFVRGQKPQQVTKYSLEEDPLYLELVSASAADNMVLKAPAIHPKETSTKDSELADVVY